MPFVQIIYKADSIDVATVVAIRDAVRAETAASFTRHDRDHLVTESMVDVTVRTTERLDLLEPPLYVTVLARAEAARREAADLIVSEIEAAAAAAGTPQGSLVELILTERHSHFRYVEG